LRKTKIWIGALAVLLSACGNSTPPIPRMVLKNLAYHSQVTVDGRVKHIEFTLDELRDTPLVPLGDYPTSVLSIAAAVESARAAAPAYTTGSTADLQVIEISTTRGPFIQQVGFPWYYKIHFHGSGDREFVIPVLLSGRAIVPSSA
jgi:hypothetical protein